MRARLRAFPGREGRRCHRSLYDGGSSPYPPVIFGGWVENWKKTPEASHFPISHFLFSRASCNPPNFSWGSFTSTHDTPVQRLSILYSLFSILYSLFSI